MDGFDMPVMWKDLRQVGPEELGYSGTPIYNGFLDTEEWVQNLKGVELFKTIDQMRFAAGPSAIEKGFSLPVEQGKLYFKYDDSEVEKDPFYAEQINFIKTDFENLNRSSFLHNANLAFTYGFSLFEQIYSNIDSNGKMHLINLSSRLPKTIWRWIPDERGNLVGVQQLVYVYGPNGKGVGWQFVPIPAKKLLLITNNFEGQNYAGRSNFRPFYREWKIEDFAMKQLAITIERVGGGVPYAILDEQCPEDTPNDGQTANGNRGGLSQIQEILRKMKGSENSYMAAKWVKQWGLLTLDPGAIDSLLKLSQHCTENMYKSAFQMVMSLGTSSTGSRALGDTFEGLYYNGLEGNAQTICSAIDEQVIKRLIYLNFGPQKHYPKSHIELKQNISQVSKIIGDLKRFGVIQGNTEIENTITGELGLPATTPENALKPEPQTPAEQSGAPVEPQQLSDLHLTDMKIYRKPKHKKLKSMNFEDMRDDLNTAKRALSRDTRTVVEPEMIRMGKLLGQGEKIYNLKFGYGNKLADVFREHYKRLKNTAKAHITNELKASNIKLADKLYLADVKKTWKDWEDWYNDEAGIDADGLENDAKNALGNYYSAARSQGLEGDALSAFIIDSIMAEKGQRYNDASDALLQAYGNVRELTAQEFKDIVKTKIRVGIFDANQCDHCAQMDGVEFYIDKDGNWNNDDGYMDTDLPDQDCDGSENKQGNACRCIYVYQG